MADGYTDDERELSARYARTRARINDIEEMPPGPTALSALVALRGAPNDATDAVRLDALWARHISWAHAQRMIATVDAVNGGGHAPGLEEHERCEVTSHEIGAATSVGFAAASSHVSLALTVGDQLSQSWLAMDRGELSLHHVRTLARVTDHCPPRVMSAVDAAVIPLAIERRWTPEQLAKAARRAILAVDPDGAAERAKRAKADTDVRFYPEPDQMGTVHARGDAATARQVYDTINARAAQLNRDGDTRTAGQRRYAALLEFILGRSASGSPSSAASAAQQVARRRGEAQVRLNLSTALGLDDEPGELDGYGPITAELARSLAKDAAWRRWLTDPITGKLIDLGRRTYTPSEALRRFIEARDLTCQFPGCERPARRCQIDHKVAYDTGGRTDRPNLQPLCQMHHQLKTHKIWRVDANPDGTDVWRSGLGFTYQRHDGRYRIPAMDPPDDLDTSGPPEPLPSARDVDPPYPRDPYPDPALLDEPPLDPYEAEALDDVLTNSWGVFSARAYNLLRAAQLIE